LEGGSKTLAAGSLEEARRLAKKEGGRKKLPA